MGPPGALVASDRKCVSCGYSLAGLRVGGLCPECGTTIAAMKYARFAENIADAPRWYLWTLALGLALMLVGMLAALASLVMWVATNVGLILRPTGLTGALWQLGWAATALSWASGVFLVTKARPRSARTAPDAVLDSPRLRLVLRWGQVLVVAAWFALLFAALAVPAPGAGAPPPLAGAISDALLWASGVLFVGWLVVLAGVGIYLSALADWANDGAQSELMRAAAIGIGAGTVVLLGTVLVFGGGLGFLAFFQGIVALGVVLSMLGLCLGVASLLRTTLWAVANSRSAEEKAQRLAEMARKRADEMAARSAGLAVPVDEAHAAEDAPHADGAFFGGEAVPCSACRYDLRGLPEFGVCPECGVAYRLPVSAAHIARPDSEVEDAADIPLTALEDAPAGSPGRAASPSAAPAVPAAPPASSARIRHRAASISMPRIRRMEGGPEAPLPKPLPEPASYDARMVTRPRPVQSSTPAPSTDIDTLLDALPDPLPDTPPGPTAASAPPPAEASNTPPC